jgi:PAS domain S-box-containing protein
MTDLSKFPQYNPAPVIKINYQGLILATNPAAVKIIGNINAKSIFEVFTNLDKKSLVRKTFQFEQILQDKNYLFTAKKDISSKSWYLFASDTTSLQNQKIAMLNVLEDLQDKTKTLEESENRFKQIFNTVNAGIMLVNIKSKKVTLANSNLCQMLQYDQKELLKMTLNDFYSKKDAPTLLKLFAKGDKEAILGSDTVSMVRKDKSTIICSINPSLISLKGKAHILCILNNITAQERMIETLKIKDYAIESSHNGIIITNLGGKIEYINPAFADLFNIEDRSLILFMDIRQLLKRYINSEDLFAKVIDKGEWKSEIEINDGKIRYLRAEAHLVTDEFSEPLSVVFSFIDITEEKISQLIRLDFTNIAAHELKTPITPIKSFLNLIKEDPSSFGINETGLSYINTCLKNVERLDRLIGDILDISKLDAGGMHFNFEKFNLVSLINTEISNFSDDLKKSKIVLATEIPGSDISIYGDKGRISQVLGNLIKNAIKFTEKGSILVKLSCSLDKVQVDVIDSGIGIRKSDSDKLFTKFFQAEDITTRRTKGTGLGLVISKEIIKAHRGEIWATSQGRGKGSTFSFTLSTKKITPFLASRLNQI